MSRRPTDWSPLAGHDPVPGDPDEIERVARSLTDMAEEITRQATNLRTLSTAEGWDADAGRTFADSARDLAGQLDQAHNRYATAGGALKGYAPELRHAQSVADTALADAKAAQGAITTHQPPAQPPAAPTPDQATTERHRQHAYDGGIDALQAAQRKLADATHHRDEHAGRAARAIRDSIDHDGLKDSWWDKFTNWISEHADLLKAISAIAGWIAVAASVLAVVLSVAAFFFPVLIPVAALLVPILFGLAAVASAVALVADTLLTLSGDGSWFDVGLDILGLVGAGALTKITGRVAVRVMNIARISGRWLSLKNILKIDKKIPSGWGKPMPNKKDVGLRWTDPKNPGNGVRIDKGNPNSPSPSQRVDHVIIRHDGKIIGRNGKEINGSIKQDGWNAHVPLDDWLKWSRWDTP